LQRSRPLARRRSAVGVSWRLPLAASAARSAGGRAVEAPNH
jgi:hypothetical protein